MNPTEKQIQFAKAIAEEFGTDLPDGEDREGYSSWISGLADEFYRRQKKKRIEERRKKRRGGVHPQRVR